MKQGLFSDKDFIHRLWNLTLPLAFQSLMLALVAACDAVRILWRRYRLLHRYSLSKI